MASEGRAAVCAIFTPKEGSWEEFLAVYADGPFAYLKSKPGLVFYGMGRDDEKKQVSTVVVGDSFDTLDALTTGDAWTAAVAPVRALLGGPPVVTKWTLAGSTLADAAAVKEGAAMINIRLKLKPAKAAAFGEAYAAGALAFFHENDGSKASFVAINADTDEARACFLFESAEVFASMTSPEHPKAAVSNAAREAVAPFMAGPPDFSKLPLHRGFHAE